MGLRYLENVVSLELNESRCNGCGMCLAVCPHGVFVLENGRARIADRDVCIECGACQRNCPLTAVTVNPGSGCAAAIIQGALQGTAPACGCSQDRGCCEGGATGVRSPDSRGATGVRSPDSRNQVDETVEYAKMKSCHGH